MTVDIRDKTTVRHDDIVRLNFIRNDGLFVFRRHFRQGLRSHIMEVLNQADVQIENTGTVIDGARWFPRARPTNMLRIFRTRLSSLESALAEIERVKAVVAYLGSDHIAESSEFIVDYHGPQGTTIMLCGFQTYVAGELLDPWSLLEGEHLLSDLYASLHGAEERSREHQDRWIREVRQQGDRFVRRIKRMITEAHHIPDLAGAGNLVLQKSGGIKLVDINNISPVAYTPAILRDDKGYPVCDKSIEALSLIEAKIVGRPIHASEKTYRFFLDADRQRQVGLIEEDFYRRRSPSASTPPGPSPSHEK